MPRFHAVLALAAGTALAACATTTGTSCDRDCLIDVVDSYVASFAAHDPSRAPLADDVKVVENVTVIAPGEGLWRSVSSAPTGFQITIPDPIAQSVGYFGVMTINDAPGLIALRLQLQDGRIVEAEHLVAGPLNEESMAGLQAPRPGLLAEVPPTERMRRDQLVAIAGLYYDALEGDNGSLAPFADDCMRQENGRQITSNPAAAGTEVWHRAYGCAAQLDTGVMAYIDRLDNRRVFAADPVTGLAIGLSHFRHSMERSTFPIFGVPGRTERVLEFAPFDLPAAHIYKITDGQIHEIEAMGFRADHMAPTGWE
jgi:hypothetical protein